MVSYIYNMRVIATNLAVPREISWKGRIQQTGIYKNPVPGPIQLKDQGVTGDLIGNPKVHGGEFKACYLFSSEHYPYWKKRYSDMRWDWGMFGENMTTEGLLDTDILIGNIYKIGSTLVQATIPREPCYKLGVKFNDQGIIDDFVAHGYPGSYVRILEEGEITTGDSIHLIEKAKHSISIADFFRFLYEKEKDQSLLSGILRNQYLPEYKKQKLQRFVRKV